MQFEHTRQHSLANLRMIEQDALREKVPLREAIALSNMLVAHAHPYAMRPIALLRDKAPHGDVRAFAREMEQHFDKLRKLVRFEQFDTMQVETFYALEGPIFMRKSRGSDRLLVVFTTMFNNFFYSNAVLAALLSRLDCHLLFLRDTSKFHYLRGAAGIADRFPAIGQYIVNVARSEGAGKVYLTGFSSGGYAALLTSLRIPCDGFLGFSHETDLSPEATLKPPQFFTPDVAEQVEPDWQVDLRLLLKQADPGVPRMLYFGETSGQDSDHARHLEGLATIRLCGLGGTGHNTPGELFARNALLPAFAALIEGGSNWPLGQKL